MAEKVRCVWVGRDPLMIAYHDKEWGRPWHEDRRLFEYLVLDAAQAGLSWSTVLKKRENYRQAFHNFDPTKIAHYSSTDLRRLLKNPGIIRNKLKIKSAVINAQEFIKIQEEFGSFDKYIWQFVNYKTIQNRFRTLKQLPAFSPESVAMSRDLKNRGFRFVGPTICYAFMQAAGMVNDHLTTCFLYRKLSK